ncbi:MFS family permease [Bacillus thermophilus]|uniref:MFS family permease n=1 Tax=Siminovitchia thermophila TaxID=1245522 RepID=A0ABS2R0P4_9BACI|nr:MFS transporter [Siminovitchia thermophila]MBM7713213.1 MFS family permease [Siminovitchia thermophila]
MKSKHFRLLWLGQLFANLGDVLYIVGLISILYAAKESAFYLAMLPFLNTFGRFAGGLLFPILLNRYRLTSLLAGSQCYKTVVLFILILWISFQPPSIVWPIFICIWIIAFLDGWAAPAMNALVPRLVKREELVKANSFVAVIYETTQLGGWAFGGLLTVIFHGEHIIWLTFVLFVISSIMMKGIVDETSLKAKRKKCGKRDEIKEGWLLIWNNRFMRSIHIVIVLETAASVVWVAAILYVFVSEVLHVTEAFWGYINAAFFTGLMAGGLCCLKFAFCMERHMRKIVISVSIGISIMTIWFGLNSITWIALILVAFSGFLEQVKRIIINTYIQTEASLEDLPKIYSAQHALISLIFGLFVLMFGAIAEYVSVKMVFIGAGFLLAIAALYMTVHFPAHFKKGAPPYS